MSEHPPYVEVLDQLCDDFDHADARAGLEAALLAGTAFIDGLPDMASWDKVDPKDMSTVIKQQFDIYQRRYADEMFWRFRTAMERCYKAGQESMR